MKSSQFEDRVLSVENKWSLYLLVLSATNETLTFVWCYDAEVTLHVERSDHEYFYKKYIMILLPKIAEDVENIELGQFILSYWQ